MSIDGISDSLAHVGRLRTRQAQLTDLAVQAEEQFCHRVGVAHRAGHLHLSELVALCLEYRQATGRAGGFALRWDEAVSVPMARCLQYAKALEQQVYELGPAWQGPMPLCGAPTPMQGVHVVYVLYDAENAPCYVGSSSNLRARLRNHRGDGKQFAYWRAQEHPTRAIAREKETELLQDLAPYMNVRRTA